MDIVKKENQTRYTIKAPGKCLLTGGYLILHPNQKGLSVSVDAYTQAMIQIKLTQSSSSIIHIHSIDMNETWNYEVLENGTIKTFQFEFIIKLIIEKILQILIYFNQLIVFFKNSYHFIYKEKNLKLKYKIVMDFIIIIVKLVLAHHRLQ